MKKLKIEDLKEDLQIGEFGEMFTEYTQGYISDIIEEIADSQVDIYTVDLFGWAETHIEDIGYTIEEFGVATDNNNKPDFIKTIMATQAYCNERNIIENLESSLIYFIYDYIKNVLDIDEITEEQNDNLLDFNFSTSEYLENLVEHIKNIMIESEM